MTLTVDQRLLPFLRFSKMYPRIREPPRLLGESQEMLMQFSEALITFGGAGGPGKAEAGGNSLKDVVRPFFLLLQSEFKFVVTLQCNKSISQFKQCTFRTPKADQSALHRRNTTQ